MRFCETQKEQIFGPVNAGWGPRRINSHFNWSHSCDQGYVAEYKAHGKFKSRAGDSDRKRAITSQNDPNILASTVHPSVPKWTQVQLWLVTGT